MPALVKVNIKSKQANYIKFKPDSELVKVKNSRSNYAILIAEGEVKNNKDEVVTELEPGKKYKVNLGTVSPIRYHIEAVFNGALKHSIQPTVSFERFEPDLPEQEVGITFTALKAVKLDEIPHWISIYMLD